MSSISAGTTSTTTLVHSGDTTGSLVFKTNDTGSGGTTAVTIDTSQNVGVNTTSPIYKLNVKQPNNTSIGSLLGVTSSADDSSLALGYRSDIGGMIMSATYASTGSYQPLIFRTSDTNRVNIDTSGNVIIGSNVSTTAVGQLSVYGAASTKTEIYMMRSGQVEGHIGFLSGSANSNWYFNTSASLGNTGVYMTNNGTSWTSNSDERLKTDLQPIENAASKVASLRAVTGRYKTDVEGTSRAFLIAQDVQAVLPEAISTTHVEGDDTDYLGVAYTDLIPLLVASVKELKAINDRQAETIAQLQADVAALKAK